VPAHPGGPGLCLTGAYRRVFFDPPDAIKKIPHSDPKFGRQHIFTKFDPKRGLWIYKKGETESSVELASWGFD